MYVFVLLVRWRFWHERRNPTLTLPLLSIIYQQTYLPTLPTYPISSSFSFSFSYISQQAPFPCFSNSKQKQKQKQKHSVQFEFSRHIDTKKSHNSLHFHPIPLYCPPFILFRSSSMYYITSHFASAFFFPSFSCFIFATCNIRHPTDTYIARSATPNQPTNNERNRKEGRDA